MCLGVPGKIIEIKGEWAKVDVGGTKREVSLALLEGAKLDSYVIVHAGFAIQTLDEDAAQETIRFLDGFAGGRDTA
ncbi:MAG: HypC/HybG/HupF family hydrogenase formation chaperone [Deltaproteobacteria bacterium]|nr:HypC/HybG/HupF family hydrogenase formation chaperone [Deltaproteobacteria bacterium]